MSFGGQVRGWSLNLATAAAAVAVALVLVEIGLRLTWQGFYVKDRMGFAQPHPTRGWENRPGIRAEMGDAEYSTTVQHDSWGFRGAEISRQKPRDRYRILVLGDSFTYGMGVGDQETFCARLEKLDPRLQVINAGVIGYDTGQELLLLRDQGLSFSPDLVLVAFFWNDVTDAFKRRIPPFGVADGQLRFPPERHPGDPPLMQWPSSHRQLLRYSYTYRFLSDRILFLRWRLRVLLGLPVDEADLLRPDEVEPAWQLERALLRELAQTVQQSGAQLLVVVLPEGLQVQPDIKVQMLPQRDYAVQERMRDVGRELGIPVFDLLPGMRRAYDRAHVPLFYLRDRHFTSAGHRVAAELILQELRRRGLGPR